MELDELKQMNAGDLRVKEREAREEIFRLRLKLRTNQLDNPSNYRRARKELARIMTLLRQKSGPAAGAHGAATGPAAKASDARAS
ncbi:MAG TPA: 50S ribosomal protein L29 [Candidatus Binataceae bacterium]